MRKKLVSLVLAATMTLSMATTVFAESTAAVAGTATEDAADNAAEQTAQENASGDEALLGATDDEETKGTGYIDLSTLSLSTKSVNPGGTLTLTCKTANVKRMHFYYDYNTTDGVAHNFQTCSYSSGNDKGSSSYDETTGTWTIVIKVPSNASAQVWELDDIQLIDNDGKFSYVWDSTKNPNMTDAADLSSYNFGVGGAVVNSNSSTSTSANATNTPHYDIRTDGGDWNGSQYTLNGETVKNAFFCDGTYTYFLQNDGTPMTDRLTYHPNGVNVIYFDANGHEVFSNFTNVKKSISGDAVDDLCFFDVNGYMYVDVVTYDQAGTNLYYANQYGVMERSGWFTFSSNQGGGTGYANADGTLAVNVDTYTTDGTLVHIGADGRVQ